MRILTVLLVVFTLGLVSAPASAQGEVKEKFVDFEELVIDGELRAPAGYLERVQGNAKFQRMLDLKKSFLPKIQETADANELL